MNARETIYSFVLIFTCMGSAVLSDQEVDSDLAAHPVTGGLMVSYRDVALEPLGSNFGHACRGMQSEMMCSPAEILYKVEVLNADKADFVKRYPLRGVITSRR